MKRTNPPIPILILSGWMAGQESVLQLVDEFVAKGDPVDSLLLVVQQALSRDEKQACKSRYSPRVAYQVCSTPRRTRCVFPLIAYLPGSPKNESSRSGQAELQPRPSTARRTAAVQTRLNPDRRCRGRWRIYSCSRRPIHDPRGAPERAERA